MKPLCRYNLVTVAVGLALAGCMGGAVFADPDGSGHTHTTSLGDSSGSTMNSAISQAPPQILRGTSYDTSSDNTVTGAAPIPLSQPIRAKGNGLGALSVEEKIGEPTDGVPVVTEIRTWRAPAASGRP